MARYGQAFKGKAVARMLPPESTPAEEVAREVGVSVSTLKRWHSESLLQLPGKMRASPNQTKQGGRRIKELERDLRRKNAALAETTALLVLSKKLEAIFHKDKGEDE